jgi:hypothetical protein
MEKYLSGEDRGYIGYDFNEQTKESSWILHRLQH